MTTTSRWSSAEVRQLLTDLETSGLSLAAFARERGIAPHRLYWARNRARSVSVKAERAELRSDFSEVIVADRTTNQVSPIELRLPTGLSISVTADFDEVALRRLLGLLGTC